MRKLLLPLAIALLPTRGAWAQDELPTEAPPPIADEETETSTSAEEEGDEPLDGPGARVSPTEAQPASPPTVNEIERLTPLMAKVVTRHGELHPELYELQSIFSALSASLLPHMQKEEMVLFPYIKMLSDSTEGKAPFAPPHFGTVENPIRMMMMDHDTDGERLRKMRSVTDDYALPEGACPSFTALYAGLEDLEKDLHRHIHLENNVLFPAAAKMERSAVMGR